MIGYPSGQDGAILPARDLPAVSRMKNFPKTKFVRSRWLDTGLVLSFASLWTLTSSQSINTQKRTSPISSHPDLTLGTDNPYLLNETDRNFGHVSAGVLFSKVVSTKTVVMSIFATFKFSVQNGRCRKGFPLALLLWVVEISLFHAKPAYIITNAVTE